MPSINTQELESKIQEIISNMTGLEREEIKPDAHFYQDLGIDSIKGIELTVALQESFNIRIDDDKIAQLTDLRKVADEVRRLMGKEV